MRFVRPALLSLVVSLAFASTAQAVTPELTHVIATVAQKQDKNGIAPKAPTYSNLDVTEIVTTTTKTPNYATVVTPVYTAVKQPVYNAKGVIVSYRTVQVQTGATTPQKLAGYTTTTTKAAAITSSSPATRRPICGRWRATARWVRWS